MKKFLALLLALAMIFALAACGSDEQKPEDDKKETTSASDEKTEPSESESTEPSESESTEPSDSEVTEPGESEVTEPSKTETVAPSEGESTAPSEEEPTVEPTVPSEDEPTVEPTVPSEDEPTVAPTIPTEDEPVAPEGIDPDLIGTWSGLVTVTGDMMGMPGLDASLDMAFTMAFDSQGKAMFALDEEAIVEEIPAFIDAMIPAMVEMFYDEMGGKEAAEQMMQETYGMSAEEYFESIFDAEAMEEELLGSLGETSETAYYTIENGQIVIDGDGVDYEIRGDKLILSGGALTEGMEEVGLDCLELTRLSSEEPFIPEPEPEEGEDPEDPPVDIPTEGDLDPALLGTWAGSIEADGTMMDMPDLDATLIIDLTMSFDEDGWCTMVIDEDALRENISVFLDEAIPYMVQMVYDEMGGEEAAEQMMQESMGMSVTEFYESMLSEDTFVDMILSSLDETSAEMEYYVADGQLYIGDTGSDYSIDGDKLILSGGDLGEEMEEFGMDSLELTKVA